MALLQADLGNFGTPTCYLACLVASLWRPGGPWGDLGTLESITKHTLRSRLGFLWIFGRFRDPILKAFWVPWSNKGVFVLACFQVSFSDVFLGLDMDVWNWKTKRLARDVFQKSTFREVEILMMLWYTFHDFGWPRDQFL